MATLILIRHGKSEYNAKGLWCGWIDINLHEDGVAEARTAGHLIRDIDIHAAHASQLKRTHQTMDTILKTLGKTDMAVKKHVALNERHYGIYAGKNKEDIKKLIGEESYKALRRGWDVPIPEGESLKEVHARVVPYFEEHILPDLKNGKNVLVVAHGNSLRALIKHVEQLSDEAICERELATGEVHCYHFDDATGAVRGKEIRTAQK